MELYCSLILNFGTVCTGSVGALEVGAQASKEAPLGYHPDRIGVLTYCPESGRGTVSGGQFDWGGRLLKCNGGALRFPQRGWKSCVERKGIRELDCETKKSSRYESRA